MEQPILHTRIRFARNLEQYPFPPALTMEGSTQVIGSVLRSLAGWIEEEHLTLFRLKEIPAKDRLSLFRQHLISADFLDQTIDRALLISPAQEMSLMINEEDHFRLQVLKKGFSLWAAFEEAQRIQDILEARLSLAYHPKLGYLTACPSNVGTGLRASVQLHLPGLGLSKDAPKMVESLTRLGYELRGTFGEGTEVLGDVYQLSNRRTLGLTETQMIRELEQIVEKLLLAESAARQKHVLGNAKLEEAMYRALGILHYTRRLPEKEAYDLLSMVRLGAELFGEPFPTFSRIDEALAALNAIGMYNQVQQEAHLTEERAAAIRGLLSAPEDTGRIKDGAEHV